MFGEVTSIYTCRALELVKRSLSNVSRRQILRSVLLSLSFFPDHVLLTRRRTMQKHRLRYLYSFNYVSVYEQDKFLSLSFPITITTDDVQT